MSKFEKRLKEMQEKKEQLKDQEVKNQLLEEVNVYQALAKFMLEAPVLTKTLSNDFANYKYVDLAQIVQKVTPILAKNNLVVVQTMKGTGLLTELVHTKSLSKIESYCEIPQNVQMKGQNTFQVYGSAITYFRKYQYTTILGLVADDDVDTKVAKTGKPKLSKERLKEAKKAIDAGEITVQEITDRFTLTQGQKQELIK